MANASRRLPSVTDKQLDGVAPAVAKRKWREGLPVTLKEMAVALELGYSTVRHYSKMPGFPMLKGFVHPTHFDRWLERSFHDQSSGAVMPAVADNLPLMNTISPQKFATLPIRAQKLMKDAGIQM